MSNFVSPSNALHSAGTWTPTNASNMWYARRTAADATWVSKLPIIADETPLPIKLVSVDIYWIVTALAMDAVAAVLYRRPLPKNGVAAGAAVVIATSYDAGHDTAPERLTLDEHVMRLTLTAPEYLSSGFEYYVELSCDAGATSVFDLYGWRANFSF